MMNQTQNLLCASFLAGVAVLSPLWVQAAQPDKQIPATPVLIQPAKNSASDKVDQIVLKPGDVAPDFATKDLASKDVKLSQYKGKMVVLDFWATWCGPCMKSMPHTQEIAKEFKGQDIVVLAVCTSDSRVNFEKWVKANQEKYPDIQFTCDPNERGSAQYDERASKKLYGVRGIPTQFLIDKEGKLLGTIVGYDSEDNRMVALLGRSNIKVDPTLSAKGEDQLKNEKK